MRFRTSVSRASMALWAAAAVIAMMVAAALIGRRNTAEEWKRETARLIAAGALADWRSAVPPAPPDEENVYAAPIVRSWLPKQGESVGAGPALPHELAATPSIEELAAIPETRLKEFAAAFSKSDASLAAFIEAGRRPFVYLPGDYTAPAGSPLPDFVRARSVAQALATRARVWVLLGDSAKAARELEALAVVIRALESNPAMLVTVMIRSAVAGLYMDVVQEGLGRAIWREDELASFQAKLASVDFVRQFTESIAEVERAAMTDYLDSLVTKENLGQRQKLIDAIAGGVPVREYAVSWLPAAWVRRNQLAGAELLGLCLEIIDPSQPRFDPEKKKKADAAIAEIMSRRGPRNFLAATFIPNFPFAAVNIAAAHRRARELAVACGLFRWHRTHGDLPAELSSLVPELMAELPSDIVTGQPPAYVRADPNRFLLSSGDRSGALGPEVSLEYAFPPTALEVNP